MGGRTGLRRSIAVLVLVPAPVVLAAPAQAHPFGPPQTVAISRAEQSGVVRVHWQPGAPDDYSYLAVGIGVSAEDLTQGPGGLLAVKKDADALQASPRFTRYLTEHVTVRDGATACAATVLPIEHLVGDGVDLEFDCGASTPTDDVDVRVSLLTDLHPAYQTLATGPGGQRFAYTHDATDHRWALDAEAADADLGRSAALQLPLALGGLVVAGAGITLTVRRTTRRTRA